MKKLITLFAVIAFTNCAHRASKTYFFDFRQYTEQGFYIYPYHPTSIDHQPIGEISVEVADALSYDEWTDTNSYNGKKDYVGALKLLVESAKSSGANCILDFRIERNSRNYIYMKGFAVELIKEQ